MDWNRPPPEREQVLAACLGHVYPGEVRRTALIGGERARAAPGSATAREAAELGPVMQGVGGHQCW